MDVVAEQRIAAHRRAAKLTVSLLLAVAAIAAVVRFAPAPVEQAVGMLLVLAAMIDLVATVLYARAADSVFSYRAAFLLWWVLWQLSRPFAHRRGTILTFCGPAVIMLLVAVWAAVFTVGMALILHPMLGASVRADQGPTSTDFVAALFAAGNSLAIVGASELTPHTDAARLVYLLSSVIGVATISMSLTYVMQVYTALKERNSLALLLHDLSGQTGDAAALLAGLGPSGRFDAGFTVLASLAQRIAAVKEAHHFYPVLFYFRFREPFYAVSRLTLVTLDTVALIHTALSDRTAWLKESAPVQALARASVALLVTLEQTFLPAGAPERRGPPDEAAEREWRARYREALRRLRAAGVETAPDEERGAERYIAERGRWHHHHRALAPALGYDLEEIDLAVRETRVAVQGARRGFDPV